MLPGRIAIVMALFLSLALAASGRTDDPGTGRDISGSELPVVTSTDGEDRPGADFWLIRMPGPSAFGPCANYCRSTPRCGAYTVVRPTAPGTPYLCYLKDRIPPAVRNGCCLSGVKENFRPLTAEQLARDPRLQRTPRVGERAGPAAPRPGALQVPLVPISPLPPAPVPPADMPFGPPIPGVSVADGTDLPGRDYRRLFPAANARACAEACAADQPRCRAYTFVRAGFQESQPVCYLKDAIPPARPDTCCISGVVDGAGSNFTPPSPARPAGSYQRSSGRFEGPSDQLLNNLSSSDRRWPSGLAFDQAGCEMACDNPAAFTGGYPERRTCEAYSFMQAHGPYEATCTTFTRVPPVLVPDRYTISGQRR